jgi:hypothetical protein
LDCNFEDAGSRERGCVVEVTSDNDCVALCLKEFDERDKVVSERFAGVFWAVGKVESAPLLMPGGGAVRVGRGSVDLVDGEDSQRRGVATSEVHIAPSSHGVAAAAFGLEAADDVAHCDDTGAAGLG